MFGGAGARARPRDGMAHPIEGRKREPSIGLVGSQLTLDELGTAALTTAVVRFGSSGSEHSF